MTSGVQLSRPRTLTCSSTRSVTLIPPLPPAHVFSIPLSASVCASRASSSSVSTYGGLNTRTSTL